jgi:hypothetical protein
MPFIAHADGFIAQRRLAIQAVCGQGDHVFDIRNSGNVTTSILHYKLSARASEVMPAFKTWDLLLFPLAPGAVFQLSAPRAAWGFKLTLEVDGGASGTVVDAPAPKAIPYPNFCW